MLAERVVDGVGEARVDPAIMCSALRPAARAGVRICLTFLKLEGGACLLKPRRLRLLLTTVAGGRRIEIGMYGRRHHLVVADPTGLHQVNDPQTQLDNDSAI